LDMVELSHQVVQVLRAIKKELMKEKGPKWLRDLLSILALRKYIENLLTNISKLMYRRDIALVALG
ncbi:27229_t:CDS:2, partial [Racocetra persica]